MVERILLAVFALTFPLVAYVSTLPPERFRNEITEWGDQKSAAYTQFVDYRKRFGTNELVVVTWHGCHLDDDRVDEVTRKIESRLGGLVERVFSGQRLFRQLQDRAKLSEPEALKRLRNVFLAPAGEGTGVGFYLSPSARNNRGEVVQRLNDILKNSGVDPQTAAFAGLGHNLYSLDRAGLESPFRMVPQIMLLAFLLTLWFVRNFWLAFFINALGTYCGCFAFNIIHLADVDMNAIIWPLPTLTMLLSVSASLHFLSYYRKAAESLLTVETCDLEVDREARRKICRDIAKQARRHATWPILCCSVTTGIGLLSLLLSSSQPVRQFGQFGALSIAAATGFMLLFFPPFLTSIEYALKQLAVKPSPEEAVDIGGQLEGEHLDGWSRLAALTDNFRWPIVVSGVLALLVCTLGVPQVKTGSHLQNFFPDGHEVLSDASQVEKHLGPLGSIELLLHFTDPDRQNNRLKVQGLSALCGQIIEQTDIESCLSAATFAPKFKRKPTPLQKAAENNRVGILKQEMFDAGLFCSNVEKSEETWRVSCRYGLSGSLDVRAVSDEIESLASEFFVRDGRLVFPGEELSVSTTGEFVLFDHVDRQFFRELLMTYAVAFLAITIVVLLVLRNTRMAFIALLPNLFPAVIVLGMAGFLSKSLDVASLMTASVALGIAVDDTLHFLLWNGSIEQRMRYCGKAMLQTSMILGASIVLYAFCGFLPTVRFGILLSGMMFAALVGDLLFLPALMACFCGQKK